MWSTWQVAIRRTRHWTLCAEASLLRAIRLSGWEATGVPCEAAASSFASMRHLEEFIGHEDLLGCSAKEIKDCARQLECCRQWVLLHRQGLPEARSSSATMPRELQ